MREKPIIFNTPMVQAILDGRKTQTRRVIKPQPKYIQQLVDGRFETSYDGGFDCDVRYIKPRYQPGDILWVRESWCENRGKYFYKADNICNGCTEDGICLPEGVAKHITCELCEDKDGYIKWRPSIHMPREAARIFLRVTNVRVERVQDITKDEAIKEGAKAYGQNNCSGTSARIAFAEIWDKTTTEHEWRTNPWVWVIEFKKISKDLSALNTNG